MMWKWIETLLAIEAIVLVAIGSLLLPYLLWLIVRDAWITYQYNKWKRNRR